VIAAGREDSRSVVHPKVYDEAELTAPIREVERIVTDQVMLERYRVTHAPMVWQAIEESRAMLQPWVPEIAGLTDLEQVSTGLAGLEHAWENKRKLVFAILTACDRHFLGEVGIYAIDWTRSAATVGVWLRTDAEGHRYASIALSALAQYANQQLRLSVLCARVHPANVRSIRLMRRTGFCLAGVSPAIPSAEGDTAEVLVYKRLLPAPCAH
jgi:RimJ/RimL family protein N-acetyltransferase